MKKPKKQKKPSYKSLAFDLAQAKQLNNLNVSDNYALRREVLSLKEEKQRLQGELDSALYARENKMKQLGLYFAALDSLPGDHERLIQLQDELFDRTFETPSTNTL